MFFVTAFMLITSEVSFAEEAQCPKPVVWHGKASSSTPWKYNDGYHDGDRVEVTCDEGFQLPPPTPSYVQCLSGSWERDLATVCQEIGRCPIPSIRNGKVLVKEDGGYLDGDTAQVICDDGYQLTPPTHEHILCLADGSWRTGLNTMPTCLAEECSIPSDKLLNGYIVATLDGLVLDLEISSETVPTGTTVHFYCNPGYSLSNDSTHFWTCTPGAQPLLLPVCEPDNLPSEEDSCSDPDPYVNGHCLPEHWQMDENGFYPQGSVISCHCDEGFIMVDPAFSPDRYCRDGGWTFWYSKPPICLPITPGCQQPPELNHGGYKYTYTDFSLSGGFIPNGTMIQYYCDNDYKMRLPPSASIATAVCSSSNWVGTLPYCSKRTTCDPPPKIENGNWFIENMILDFRIGARIVYECNRGYKALSGREETLLVCQDSGYWSENPPRCLAVDAPCDEPPYLANGFFSCQPANCNMFKPGTEIAYGCNKGYILNRDQPDPVVCNSEGKWTFNSRSFLCLEDHGVISPTKKSHKHSNMGAVTIVVSTSCSVLGLLLIVMILFLFKKRKGPALRGRARPLQSICSHPPPPAYSELPPESSVETAVVSDHDRTALIQFADGTQATLPTYNEVTRGRYPPQLHRFNSDRSARSDAGATSGDYRPLPTISNQVRQSANGRELSPDHRDQISISSNPRADGLSVTFGSIDTINVSDNTSTTVTLGTYDSGASNPSLATSQRACAGSLCSSSPSVNADDAPLLETHDTLSHRSQTASPAIPEEDENEAT